MGEPEGGSTYVSDAKVEIACMSIEKGACLILKAVGGGKGRNQPASFVCLCRLESESEHHGPRTTADGRHQLSALALWLDVHAAHVTERGGAGAQSGQDGGAMKPWLAPLACSIGFGRA
jgi:hypothetical protein